MATKRKRGRPKVREITPTQQRALDYIKDFIKRHRMSPGVSEIARGLGVTPSAADYLVKQLRKKRALTFRKGQSRSITLLK